MCILPNTLTCSRASLYNKQSILELLKPRKKCETPRHDGNFRYQNTYLLVVVVESLIELSFFGPLVENEEIHKYSVAFVYA